MSIATQFRRSIGTVLWVILLTAGAPAQSLSPSAPGFDPGFETRAMAHVRQLAATGIHEAGTKADRKAARYVTDQMKQAGLAVISEPFTFKSFTLEGALLEAGAEKASVVKLGFNPYAATSPISGELAYVTATDGPSIEKADLDGKLVVIAGKDGFNRVSFLKCPKAVVSLLAPDFARLKASGEKTGELRFRGKVMTRKSTNIVGVLAAKPGAREIIVSAHYDSINGPGANDNDSGVAVLLELARYFHALRLPHAVSLRFVGFGGEEFGLLGSQAYLAKHQTDLQNCELLFNIDSVGGVSAIHTDTRGGVSGLPGTIGSQLPRELADKADKAYTDTKGMWALPMSNGPLYDSSDVPEWLRTAVAKAGEGLGREVIAGRGFSSDHRVFVQAGVVATDIAVAGGAQIHAPTDVPEAVHADSMELAGRLVLRVIDGLLRPKPD